MSFKQLTLWGLTFPGHSQKAQPRLLVVSNSTLHKCYLSSAHNVVLEMNCIRDTFTSTDFSPALPALFGGFSYISEFSNWNFDLIPVSFKEIQALEKFSHLLLFNFLKTRLIEKISEHFQMQIVPDSGPHPHVNCSRARIRTRCQGNSIGARDLRGAQNNQYPD